MKATGFLILVLVICWLAPASAEELGGELSHAWLQQAGKVRFVYADWKPGSGTHPGLTTFRIGRRAQWTHPHSDQAMAGLRSVSVIPAVKKLEILIDHEMRLPTGYAFTNSYFSNLVAHEYDHVRVAVDFRPRQLLDHLLRYPGAIAVAAPADRPLNDAVIREVVNRELEARQSAVVALVSSNNDWLDSLTEHGARQLPDRPAFFRSLYTRERLRELNFPYLNQVESVLRSPNYLPLGGTELRASAAKGPGSASTNQTISTGQAGTASKKALP